MPANATVGRLDGFIDSPIEIPTGAKSSGICCSGVARSEWRISTAISSTRNEVLIDRAAIHAVFVPSDCIGCVLPPMVKHDASPFIGRPYQKKQGPRT